MAGLSPLPLTEIPSPPLGPSVSVLGRSHTGKLITGVSSR